MGRPSASGIVEDLVAVIGEPAYLRLAEAMGGAMFYVPRNPGADHPITRAVGSDTAAKIAEFFHGTNVVLPVGAWRVRAIRALAGTTGADEIAARLKVSRSYVYKVLAEHGDDRQHELFG